MLRAGQMSVNIVFFFCILASIAVVIRSMKSSRTINGIDHLSKIPNVANGEEKDHISLQLSEDMYTVL